MSNISNSRIYDEIAELLPTLTPAQAEEMDGYIKEGDLEAAQFMLNTLKPEFVVTDDGLIDITQGDEIEPF